MSDVRRELVEEMFEIHNEAMTLYGERPDEQIPALFKAHFLDRWYRLARFGINGRADLEGLTFVISYDPVSDDLKKWMGDAPPTRTVSCGFAATKLAQVGEL